MKPPTKNNASVPLFRRRYFASRVVQAKQNLGHGEDDTSGCIAVAALVKPLSDITRLRVIAVLIKPGIADTLVHDKRAVLFPLRWLARCSSFNSPNARKPEYILRYCGHRRGTRHAANNHNSEIRASDTTDSRRIFHMFTRSPLASHRRNRYLCKCATLVLGEKERKKLILIYHHIGA